MFVREEKALLRALPSEDYVCPTWQKAKVHRDHHVVFEGSFYSVPTQYIGKELWIRASDRIVDLYLDHERVKTHNRCGFHLPAAFFRFHFCNKPGQRRAELGKNRLLPFNFFRRLSGYAEKGETN